MIQRREGKSAPVHRGERELALAPLFICFSLPGPVLCKLGQPGVLSVLPEVLTPGPRTFFCFIFAGFSLPCLIATAISDSFSLFYLPNTTISSSVVPFSSRLQSFSASGSFPVSQFFVSGGQSIGVSASASVLSMNIQE